MSLPSLPDVPRERRRTATLLAVGVLGALVLVALAVGLRGLFAPAAKSPGAGDRPTPTTAATSASAGSAAASPTTAAANAAALRFVSPSGNIRCLISTRGARCDIIERDWEPPARPAGCTQRWGSGVSVDSSGSALVCDDTAVAGGNPLEYGDSVSRGSYRCDSDETGMRCTNTTTRRGFAIARAAYRLS